MVEQLGGIDAAFVGLETPTGHLQGVGVVVLDADAPHLDLDDLVALVERRLPDLHLLRRRLVTVPGGLDRPYWVEVHPDLGDHIRHHQLPSPGDPTDFERFCAEVASTKLDPVRPMWEFVLVDGLASGAQALIIKIHHALCDGIGSLALVAQLFDMSPDPAPPAVDAPARVEPEESPSAAWLLANATWHALERPFHAVSTLVDLVGSARRLRSVIDAVEGQVLAAPLATPRLPLDGPVSAQRAVAFRELPLDRVKAIARASGTHVNDVVLAVLAGALRTWLQAQDVEPDQALVAAVPVSTRTPEELLVPGNHVSACFVHLPVHIADPAERLTVTAGVADRAKAIESAVGPGVLERVTGLVFPALLSGPARAYQQSGLAARHAAPVNLVVSNVAGPPFDLYLSGRPAATFYALGPIFDGVTLNITVISFRGVLGFAYLTCPERLPDLAALADAEQTSFDELAAAFGV